jgi:sugar lactone lactonase YvrE
MALRTMIVPILVLASASPVLADEVWTLEGFQAPESALFDSERNVVYISNVAGEANAKDGIGFISKISLDGKMHESQWIKGLNAPKGMILHGNLLYVSDIDTLVEIDVTKGAVTNSWVAEGSQFLNDTAVDADGRVFVSDMLADSIYVLENGKLAVFVQDPALLHPNGLRVEGGKLLVAGWGEDIQPDFSTKTPGRLVSVDLTTKEISAVGSGEPIGNLDGLEPDGSGNWMVTDWVAGQLYRIHPDGSAEKLIDLNSGSADLEYVEREKLAIIPMMMDGKVTAHRTE